MLGGSHERDARMMPGIAPFTPQDADGFFPALSHFISLLLDWLRPGI